MPSKVARRAVSQLPAIQDRYVSDFQDLDRDESQRRPEWVNQLRREAMTRFTELGFPTSRRGNEKWKYTSVAPIANTVFQYPTGPAPADIGAGDIAKYKALGPEWTNLVFVDGQFCPSLSNPHAVPGGIQINSLASVVTEDGKLARQNLAQHASYSEDAFAALNTAFLGDGAYIHIPEDSVHSSPVHLMFLSTGMLESTVSHPRTLVVAGPRSELTLVESYVGLSSGAYFNNAVSEIVLEEGAQVQHYKLLNESAESFHVGATRVHQGQDSSFSSWSFARGTALARNDFHVLLDAPGSSCALNGLYTTAGQQHIDNYITIEHAKPHTTSRLSYKGILDGDSRAVFGGTVLVRQDAQKADSQQSDKNLLLSKEAEINSKPSLLIYADDVKCSHGATAGHIDEEAVFYMRSRGIDLATARDLMVRGFGNEIIDTVPIETLRNYLGILLLGSLSHSQPEEES